MKNIKYLILFLILFTGCEPKNESINYPVHFARIVEVRVEFADSARVIVTDNYAKIQVMRDSFQIIADSLIKNDMQKEYLLLVNERDSLFHVINNDRFEKLSKLPGSKVK